MMRTLTLSSSKKRLFIDELVVCEAPVDEDGMSIVQECKQSSSELDTGVYIISIRAHPSALLIPALATLYLFTISLNENDFSY